MPAMTIRNLSEETHRAIKARAARSGRSAEAEVRAILDAAVSPPDRTRLGTLLAQIGEEIEGVDLAIDRNQSERARVDLS